MKIKTGELKGMALGYAVALCLGGKCLSHDTVSTWWITIDGKNRALKAGWAQSFAPWADWSQGGAIIEREKIEVMVVKNGWYCQKQTGAGIAEADFARGTAQVPLVAAMRCFVASRLGNEVEIPDALLKESDA